MINDAARADILENIRVVAEGHDPNFVGQAGQESRIGDP